MLEDIIVKVLSGSFFGAPWVSHNNPQNIARHRYFVAKV
jgi:hypothetical protein